MRQSLLARDVSMESATCSVACLTLVPQQARQDSYKRLVSNCEVLAEVLYRVRLCAISYSGTQLHSCQR
jgi:hypothetical protein